MIRVPRPLRSLAAALAGLVLASFAAQAQTTPTITAIVQAGSLGNSFNVYVSNADSFSTLSSIVVRAPENLRYVENVVIAPARIDELGPNSSKEVTVTFDIDPNVPDAGARETAVFPVVAAEGMLDFSELTLKLGIETEKTRLAIVPFVVGKSTGVAGDAIKRASLQSDVEVTGTPPDPTLYDTVAAQSVGAGAIVAIGSAVTLTAYPPGLVTVPKVAGLEIAEATRRITEAGLDPKLTPLGNAPSKAQANRVDRSEPPEGDKAEPHAPVSLFAYGSYHAPPPPEKPPPVLVVANWAQPWQGEIKLTLFIGDGKHVDVSEVLKRSWQEAKAESQSSGSGTGGAVLAMPGKVASGVGGAITGGLQEGFTKGLGAGLEKVGETVDSIFGILQEGIPISITLAEEQGGFRVRIPGSGDPANEINAMLAEELPLFLPQGGNLLRGTKNVSSKMVGDLAFKIELAAAPDWQKLTLRISIKGTNLVVTSPSSFEIALIGTLQPGLYEATQYVEDLKALFADVIPQ